METEYLKIGELKIIDGEAFVKPDYYDDSLTAGNIFKDAEAYDKDWDAICYVPEYGVSRSIFRNSKRNSRRLVFTRTTRQFYIFPKVLRYDGTRSIETRH